MPVPVEAACADKMAGAYTTVSVQGREGTVRKPGATSAVKAAFCAMRLTQGPVRSAERFLWGLKLDLCHRDVSF